LTYRYGLVLVGFSREHPDGGTDEEVVPAVVSPHVAIAVAAASQLACVVMAFAPHVPDVSM
jgi:hypothetical protein